MSSRISRFFDHGSVSQFPTNTSGIWDEFVVGETGILKVSDVSLEEMLSVDSGGSGVKITAEHMYDDNQSRDEERSAMPKEPDPFGQFFGDDMHAVTPVTSRLTRHNILRPYPEISSARDYEEEIRQVLTDADYYKAMEIIPQVDKQGKQVLRVGGTKRSMKPSEFNLVLYEAGERIAFFAHSLQFKHDAYASIFARYQKQLDTAANGVRNLLDARYAALLDAETMVMDVLAERRKAIDHEESDHSDPQKYRVALASALSAARHYAGFFAQPFPVKDALVAKHKGSITQAQLDDMAMQISDHLIGIAGIGRDVQPWIFSENKADIKKMLLTYKDIIARLEGQSPKKRYLEQFDDALKRSDIEPEKL